MYDITNPHHCWYIQSTSLPPSALTYYYLLLLDSYFERNKILHTHSKTNRKRGEQISKCKVFRSSHQIFYSVDCTYSVTY